MDRDELLRDAREARELGDEELELAILEKLDSLGQEQTKGSAFSRFVAGTAEPVVGGQQLVLNSLAKGSRAALGDSGITQTLETGAGRYNDFAKSFGDYYGFERDGLDGARLAGNVASLPNVAIAALAPASKAKMLDRLRHGGASGGLSSTLTPVYEGDYWSEKGKQAAVGGIAGLLPPIAGEIASRVVRPAALDRAATLLKENISPTLGQLMGGTLNRIEEKAQSLPIIGDAITHARRGADEEFRRAAYNRALREIGDKLPDDATGRDAAQYITKAFRSKYDDVLSRTSARIDPQFETELSGLRQAVSDLPPEYQRDFEKFTGQTLPAGFTENGVALGEWLKTLQEEIGNRSKQFGAGGGFERRLGSAYDTLDESLYNLIRRTSGNSDELKQLDKGYAQFKRLQKAGSKIGAEEGDFTPAQFANAVLGADGSKDKARYFEGNALMQDLSDAGKSVLQTKYPDSGTFGRLALGSAAAGGGYLASDQDHAGGTLAALLAASAPYVGGRKAIASAMKRPEFTRGLADSVRRYATLLTPVSLRALYAAQDSAQ